MSKVRIEVPEVIIKIGEKEIVLTPEEAQELQRTLSSAIHLGILCHLTISPRVLNAPFSLVCGDEVDLEDSIAVLADALALNRKQV